MSKWNELNNECLEISHGSNVQKRIYGLFVNHHRTDSHTKLCLGCGRGVEWDLKGSIKPQDIALPDIRTFGREIKFLCVLAIVRWKILKVCVVQAPASKN